MVLFIASSLNSFSRYLWAFSVLGIVLGFLIAKKENFHWLCLGFAACITTYESTAIFFIIELRFSALVAGSSDLEKTAQRIALSRFFWDAPLLGHGLGSYTPRLIRSPELPYSYENQLLPLAGQVGMVGICILGCLLLFYFRNIFTNNKTQVFYGLSITILLAAWVASGLVNPSLIWSTASVSYGMLRTRSETKLTEGDATCSTI